MKTFKEYLIELTDYQKKFVDGFINLSDDDMKKFNDWINHHKHAFKKLIEYFKTHKIDKTGITSYKDLQKYLDIAEIETTTKPEKKLVHIKDEYKQFETIEDIKGNKYYTFIPYSLRASCEIASSKIGDVLGRWCVAECKNEDGLKIWIDYTLGEYEGVMMYIKPILRRTKEAYIRGDHKELGKILHDKNDHRIKNVNSVFDSKTINYIDDILKQNEERIKKKYIEYILRDIDKLDLENEKLEKLLSLNIENIDFIKKLENLIIKKDEDGYWCYLFARDVEGADIQRLQNAVIKKDKDGRYCYWFAEDIEGANIQKLENAIIEKDDTGEQCYEFAKYVKDENINKLGEAIIQKDKTGKWCYRFAKDVEGADISKLEDAVIKKDKDGKYCYWFALNVKGADIKKLEDAVIEKDKYGDLCYLFARDVEGINIDNILQKMKEKFGENNKYYKEVLELKRRNHEKF